MDAKALPDPVKKNSLRGLFPNKKNCLGNKFVLIYLAGVFSIAASLYFFGWTQTWSHLLVPTVYPPFVDLRTVQGALTSIAQGLDPQLSNPGDPMGRLMNYPRIWINIAEYFGLASEFNYIIFVSGYVVLFLLCCLALLGKFPSTTLLLAIFSGASLLAVERGNNDVLIFDLIFFSSLTSIIAFSGVFIFASSLLKIYPTVVFLSMLKNRIAVLLLLFTVIVLVALNHDDFAAIKNATPISISLSYGAPSLSSLIENKFSVSINPWLISIVHVGAAIIAMVIMKTTAGEKSAFNTTTGMFFSGALIYTTTFILSSNWDYRLIFLMLCIPHLFQIFHGIKKILVSIILISAMNYVIVGRLFGTIGYIFNILSKSITFEILFYQLLKYFIFEFDNRIGFPKRRADSFIS